ncbi:MAG: branched-chain amino acid ABC transporter permease [bacterium]
MGVFFQQLINGLSLGSIYALIAIGYTLVYGIMRLINFAHGDIYMFGSFVGSFVGFSLIGAALRGGAGSWWNVALIFFGTVIVAMILSSALGFLIERSAYRPLRNSPRLAALITAVGMSLLLENLATFFWGANPRPFPQIIAPARFDYLFKTWGISVNNQQLIIFLTSIALMVVLQVFLLKTKTGKAMRATTFDKETAQLMGIDLDRIIVNTFIIGSSLAAAGGVLIGIRYGRIDPLMGILPGLKAFVAAVLGGIGSVPGAMVGGFIMGVVEILVAAYISTTLRDAIAFAILIVILIVKPSGIFGENISIRV